MRVDCRHGPPQRAGHPEGSKLLGGAGPAAAAVGAGARWLVLLVRGAVAVLVAAQLRLSVECIVILTC